MEKMNFIRNQSEESKTRFISFKGDYERFDLAIVSSPSLDQKLLIIDLNTNKYTKLDQETIQNNDHIEHKMHYTEVEAEDFKKYMRSLFDSL